MFRHKDITRRCNFTGFIDNWHCSASNMGKDKGNVLPRTGHEGPEGGVEV